MMFVRTKKQLKFLPFLMFKQNSFRDDFHFVLDENLIELL